MRVGNHGGRVDVPKSRRGAPCDLQVKLVRQESTFTKERYAVAADGRTEDPWTTSASVRTNPLSYVLAFAGAII